MADQIDLSFPDQNYSAGNPPSVVTLKNDLTDFESKYNQAALEINDHENRMDSVEAGWIDAGESWTYSSVDNPTGIISISGDKTAKYSVGMRIRFINNSNTIYGIITGVTYSAPNTLVTFLHEISPTSATAGGGTAALHIMTNSSITLPFYSSQKIPFGFPADPRKWTYESSSADDLQQLTPSADTWYNPSSFSIPVPIGAWRLTYSAIANFLSGSSTGNRIGQLFTTLSTANNNESDNDLTCMTRFSFYLSSGGNDWGISVHKEKHIVLTSKTSYFLNLKVSLSGQAALQFFGSGQKTIARAICAYF